ncbi:MAG: n-acetylglutamate synthase [Wenyingzhuangia sp.]|uniref:n-acetylglutamate synthase n=1 Tax=Wenyingzhuangia sp. TaxID=1964193 RepID=UPI0032198BB2
MFGKKKKYNKMQELNYDGKKFGIVEVSGNSETSNDMIFEFKQEGNILTCEYVGGKIRKGQLLGLVSPEGRISMDYQQINTDDKLNTGVCKSRPQRLDNGKIRIHETWRWTTGDKSYGVSILEEL